MKLTPLACLVCLAACGGSGYGVDTTITFDPSVSNELVQSVTQFAVTTTGAESFSGTIPITTTPSRTETFLYRPKVAKGTIVMTVEALLPDGTIAASGVSDNITLHDGDTTRVTITLRAGAPSDAGVGTDGLPNDLYGDDLAGPHPDLGGVDFALGPITDAGCRATAGGPYFDTSAFTDVSTNSTTNDLVAVAAGDFDKDGKLDVVFTHHNNQDNSAGVDVWTNAGNRAFNAASKSPYSITCTQPSSSDIESFPAVLTVSDFNGDGQLDIVVGCGEVGTFATALGNLYFMEGNGDGTFATPVAFTTQPKGPFSGLAADIDTDGFVDFVTTDYTGTAGINVYWGAATGFATGTPTHQAVGDSPIMVSTGFLAADLIPDLVITNMGTTDNVGDYYVLRRDRTVAHSRAFSANQTTIAVSNPSTDYALGARVVHLNSDTTPDLVTFESDEMGDPSYLYTTLGTFADDVTTFGALQQSAPLHGTKPDSFAFIASDLNCDGRDEVLLSYNDTDTSGMGIDAFDVWTPTAAGTLTNVTTYSKDTDAEVVAAVIGDFDGDHLKDVLFAVDSTAGGFVLRFMYGLGSPP